MKTGVSPLGKDSLAKSAWEKICPVRLRESLGVGRNREPVSIGLPFPEGMVVDSTRLILLDQDGYSLPFQIQVLSRWSDGSMKWGMFDFFATVDPHQTVEYIVGQDQEKSVDIPTEFSMIRREEDAFIVDTGKVCFHLGAKVFQPFEQVVMNGVPFLSQGSSAFGLTDDSGKVWDPRISSIEIEASGPVRVTLKIEGAFSKAASVFAHFIARLSFFRESGLVPLLFETQGLRAILGGYGIWVMPGQFFFEISHSI